MKKKLLVPGRVRSIKGGFSYIPHRFFSGGFLASLNQQELLLYLLLIIVSDRNGISFYGYDLICSLLQFTVDDYIEARRGLMAKDLIAFDGSFFQVLELPSEPVRVSDATEDPATVAQSVMQSLKVSPSC